MNSVNKINADTAKIKDMAKDLKEMSLKAKKEEEEAEVKETTEPVQGDAKEPLEEPLLEEPLEEPLVGRTRYGEALYCLTDPLLPVRGHGLIELTRLVKEKEEETVGHIGKVIDIFRVTILSTH